MLLNSDYSDLCFAPNPACVRTPYSQTRPGLNTRRPSKGGLNLQFVLEGNVLTWLAAYKRGGLVNMVESGWIQNSAGLNCLIGRRRLIHTDVSL